MNGQATVLVPFSGNNSVTCGTSVRLQDHAGLSNYSDNANGYTVFYGGFQGVFNFVGPYVTESCCDYVRIYNGIGTGGTMLANYQGSGNANFTSTPGQTITVQFYTDGSVVYSGFDFTVTATGACFATPCAGTPGANAVITPTAPICPNSSAYINLTSYTVGGLTYQWQTSTVSVVGPFISIPNATTAAYSTPNLTVNTYYNAIITCTNSSSSITANAGLVSVSPVITSSVPYYEGFEGIPANDVLPNCSWTSSPGANCRTYTATATQGRTSCSGNKFAAFYGYFVSGSNYFYTNGIQLNAGVTYSASLWFKTEYYGYANFTDLSIMLGTSQSSTGLVTIASTGGPAASPVCKSLSNTFTVATSGLYYVAVRATSNGNYGAFYLSWDDLAIIAPCSLNSPSVTVNTSTQTVCAGQPVSLTASGADTYLWSTGATGSAITETPLQSTAYNVIGTSSLSACSVTLTSMVIVNPTPNVLVFTTKPSICAGETANIIANGASSYVWNTSSTNPAIAVTPNTTTSYTVLGFNSFSCSASAVQQIVVKPNPTVTATSNAIDPNQICKGESITLTGNGASTYQWAANTLYIQASNAIVSPQTTTTYSLTGTGTNGCSGVTTFVVVVSDCTGLTENLRSLEGVKVYPNPTAGDFTLELNNTLVKTIQVIDLNGKVISTNTSSLDKVKLNIANLANGVYYVKVQSNNAVEVKRIVKQ